MSGGTLYLSDIKTCIQLLLESDIASALLSRRPPSHHGRTHIWDGEAWQEQEEKIHAEHPGITHDFI